MRAPEFLQEATEVVKADGDLDSESSVGELVLLLLERLENLESEQPAVHQWTFSVVRDSQGFIKDVIATPSPLH